MTSINLPKVKEIGCTFLGYNSALESVNIPNVEKIGGDFLWADANTTIFNCNYNLKSINLPEKYNWLAEILLSKSTSKVQKLKNVAKKVLKKIMPRTQNEPVSHNSR